MVCSHFMPRILHISSIMLLMKLAPLSLKSLAEAPKIEMQPRYKNLAMVFAVWSGVTYTNMCFVKWSWNTKTLVTLGNWFGSNMVSMLVKSTCRRTRGIVATMQHKGALGKLPSCWRQHVQALRDCFTWLAYLVTKSVLVVRTRYGHGLGVWHLNDTHSEWKLNVLLEP